jgi:glutamate-1-semialdehyde aminotransferase
MPQPFTTQQRAYLERFADEYTRRLPGSHARRERAYPALADARSSQGWSAQLPPAAREAWAATRRLRFPIVADRCEGAHTWDIDGNAYVDFCLGFGVHLFGHRPAFLEDALHRQLARGLPIGFQSDQADEVAVAIATMTGAERVALCNTGAEAIMGAVRLARAATRRDTIAVFAHAYHGSYDATLPAIDMSLGLPASARADTLVLEYGAPRSLEILEARADTIAAVLVEPVQARSPALQPRAFLAELRALTRRRDVALIFDDVLLGFRIHQGGSQAHFGVQADLATFGKILGGGLPIGAIAGAARFLDAIDGGPWRADGDALPATDKVWFAGTFTKNPLTMAAAAAVTTRLEAAGNDLQAGLTARVASLVARASAWLAEHAVPLRIEHCGSMLRLMVTPPTWVLLPHLRLRGIYAFDGATFFLSTAHTDADLDRFLEALQDSVLAMRSGGFFV